MPVQRELVPPGPDYLARREAFVHEYEECLERRTTGSVRTARRPPGRYAVVRRPEGLIVIERLATVRYDVFAAFDGEIEGHYLTDIAEAWEYGHEHRRRSPPGTTHRASAVRPEERRALPGPGTPGPLARRAATTPPRRSCTPLWA